MNRKKIVRVISLAIVLCFILTSTVFADSTDNMKFEKDNFKWNKSADYMKDKGIMKGYGNGDFGFSDYVKRGDIAVMIVRAFNLSAILGDIEKIFPDVSFDSYYYEAIATAKYYGIAKGDGKNFNPKQNVTIGEAIALIERSVSVANRNVVLDKNVNLKDLYKDKDLDKYATRDDIAKMLYYVLTGDIYSENNDKNTDVIAYETENNVKITFDKNDFKNAFYNFEDVVKDDKLDYVKFEVPSEAYGKLYYNYDEKTDDNLIVKSSYKFFYNASSNSDREISKVSFVPRLKYAGTFNINYTAYDDNGDSYQGKIKITVKDDEVTLKPIKYTIKEDTKLTFDYKAFKDVFKNATNKDFDYVKFTIPDKKYGKLYYDYVSDSNYKSLVVETKAYDYDDIDRITFVPDSKYVGDVNIGYKAYDVKGASYNGKIEIAIKEDKTEKADLKTIKYTINKDTKIAFDSDDFENTLEAVADEDFDCVKFDLPNEKYGKLYYDYESESNSNSLVLDSKAYDEDDIDEITFVPASGYTGDVYINIIAYDEDGNSFTGLINIVVK